MPANRKPAGTKVDRRPQRDKSLKSTPAPTAAAAEVAVVRYALADEIEVPPCPVENASPYIVATWEAFWREPHAKSVTGVQRIVVDRWITLTAMWMDAMKSVRDEPMVKGSQGQLVRNPLANTAAGYMTQIRMDEQQLGIGLKNLADLGISAAMAKLTAADVNRMTKGAELGAGAKQEPAAVGAGAVDEILVGWQPG